LDDVTKEFEQLIAKDLPTLNDALKAKGQPAIVPPPEKIAMNDRLPGSGRAILPANFRVW
jgi:hypothetical protein